MTKRIVLCADDYGQAPAISEGILALIKLNRLSAVSCLVTTDNWLKYSQSILIYKSSVDIGLHINLTDGHPLTQQYRQYYGETYFSLPILMRNAFLGLLNYSAFYHEIEAQIQLFKETMGFLPHFLDGHQHVHQFPIIRKIIIVLYKKYYKNPVPIRLAAPQLWFKYLNIKKIIILLSSLFFQHALDQSGLFYNTSFSGVYDFQSIESQADYQKYFRLFLSEIKDNGLIMCHPGLLPESDSQDLIAKSRYFEYQYLSSEAFIADCLTGKISLEHFLTACSRH